MNEQLFSSLAAAHGVCAQLERFGIKVLMVTVLPVHAQISISWEDFQRLLKTEPMDGQTVSVGASQYFKAKHSAKWPGSSVILVAFERERSDELDWAVRP